MSQEFRFRHVIRVRYSEIDGQMVVFNSHYLTYFDVAMTEYFRELGLVFIPNLEDEQFDYVVAQTTIRNYNSAFFDDLLEIGVRVPYIGNTSFKVEFLVQRQNSGDLIATGETIYVGYDVKLRQKVRIPDYVREKIEKFESEGIII